MSDKLPILIILGPTASGKSLLALKIALHFSGYIINADSMQVYEDLPSLTACPSERDYQTVPHYLYEFLDPHHCFSAAQWYNAVLEHLKNSPKKLPIICGGSGFYIKTLTHGLSPIPATQEDFLHKGIALYHAFGPEKFHKLLQETDGVLAQRLHPHDQSRCIRAWCIYQQTQQPLSYWQSLPPQRPNFPLKIFMLTLVPQRPWLYDQCNQRFFDLFHSQQTFAEIHCFLKKNISHKPLNKAIGLRELSFYMQKLWSSEKSLEEGQKNTRRYAKRQYTWIKNQVVANLVLDPQSAKPNDYFPILEQWITDPS